MGQYRPLFLFLLIPAIFSIEVPQYLHYLDEYPGNMFVPLYRERREAKEPEDDPEYWKIPNDVLHQTIDHTYYFMNMTTSEQVLMEHFVDVDSLLKKPGVTGNNSHPQLASSYRRAVGAKLSFPFPFYGHTMNNITIATGGFIYIGDETHNWLAATQYVAPLMANFDTKLNGSNIIYADDGNRFIVEWRKVQLREQTDAGPFTFQVILHKNGDIVFVYKDVPMDVTNISDSNHPVKLGISDAYLYNHLPKGTVSSPGTTPKRVIYEYHRIGVNSSLVLPNTVVYLSAQPTCIGLKTCNECANATLKDFNCTWCYNSKRNGGSFCTDEAGMHRKRQVFIEGSCKDQSKNLYCGLQQEDEDDQPDDVITLGDGKQTRKYKQNKRTSGGGIAFLIFLLGLSLCAVGWLAYAYYNPHTTSGQMLIKYRPSRWSVPHSHVRYSASVHM